MKPQPESLSQKIRPFLSGATFIFLIIFVGFLSLNFIQALIDKLA